MVISMNSSNAYEKKNRPTILPAVKRLGLFCLGNVAKKARPTKPQKVKIHITALLEKISGFVDKQPLRFLIIHVRFNNDLCSVLIIKICGKSSLCCFDRFLHLSKNYKKDMIVNSAVENSQKVGSDSEPL